MHEHGEPTGRGPSREMQIASAIPTAADTSQMLLSPSRLDDDRAELAGWLVHPAKNAPTASTAAKTIERLIIDALLLRSASALEQPACRPATRRDDTSLRP
jgi:hypothetical protein